MISIVLHLLAEFPGREKVSFPALREGIERDTEPSRRVTRLITIQNARAMIFHFSFEALRSDVFNFPPRAPTRGPGRMQIVTGKLCATVKLMSSPRSGLNSPLCTSRATYIYARAIPRADL